MPARYVPRNTGKCCIVVNTVRNRSANLYWIDFNGQKKFYSKIPPSGRLVQSTYSGHAWLIENSSGSCDSVFIVENNVEIRIKNTNTAVNNPRGSQPKPNQFYKLTTMFLEKENKCLEGNKLSPRSTLRGAAFMDNCQNVSGQLWKFKPAR